MSFTIKQLHYFMGVAEHGSISSAAKKLYISQSTITESIKELEFGLGVRLFDRHSRGLKLTYNGYKFLRHANEIMTNVANAKNSFINDREDVVGNLNIGVTSLVAGYVLSDIFAKYKRAYPSVTISMIEDNTSHLSHLLIGGEIDIAVMVADHTLDSRALHYEVIDVSPYSLWLSAGHALVQQKTIKLEDFQKEPLIMLASEEIERPITELFRTVNLIPNISFRTHSVEAIRNLIAINAGVALLPNLIFRPWSLDGDKIETRDVSGVLPVVKVGFVWRKGSELTKLAQSFVDMA